MVTALAAQRVDENAALRYQKRAFLKIDWADQALLHRVNDIVDKGIRIAREHDSSMISSIEFVRVRYIYAG